MTLITRKLIRQEMLRRAGGYVATATGGSATTFVAQSLEYHGAGDDNHLRNHRIFMPDAAAANRRRVITTWSDSTGTGTFASGEDPTNDDVEIYPVGDDEPYQPDYDHAINLALSEAQRLVELVMPTVEGQTRYGLLHAPWIERKGDILGVFLRRSPNLLTNSGFELWGRGDDASLVGWPLSGASSTVTRIDGTYGRYAARLTRAGTDCEIAQTIPIPIFQLRGEQVTLWARINSAAGSHVARLQITDGTDTSSHAAHSNDGNWENQSLTHTVNADAEGPLTARVQLNTADAAIDIENILMVEAATVPQDLQDYGERGVLQEIGWTSQMYGSMPVIALRRSYGRGSQIVVQSKQPYTTLSADTDVTDIQLETIVEGGLVKLAEQYGRGENRERWNVIGGMALRRFEAAKAELVSTQNLNPTPRPVRIGPA